MRGRLVLVAGVVLGTTILAGTLASGELTSTGQGSGSDRAGAFAAVSVAALVGGDTPASSLQPGGTADVILRVKNPNPFAVRVTSVTANGTVTATGGTGTCSTTGVTFTDQVGISDTVAPSSTVLLDLPGAASMSAASESGCQGATFSVPVAITVRTP
jgi:hypothetical protein